MTTHADEEMWEDGLTIRDVENVILNGDVVERQLDRQTRESKYLIRGGSLDGQPVVVVTKFGFVQPVVIITVYLE